MQYLGEGTLKQFRPEHAENGPEARQTNADGGQTALLGEQVLYMHDGGGMQTYIVEWQNNN